MNMKKSKKILIAAIGLILLVLLATIGIKVVNASVTTQYSNGRAIYKCNQCGKLTAWTYNKDATTIYCRYCKGASTNFTLIADSSKVAIGIKNFNVAAWKAKSQLSFQKTYECANGHITTLMGNCGYNMYGHYTGVVEKLEECSLAGCGATVKEVNIHNLVEIREDYLCRFYNNIYCIERNAEIDAKLYGESGLYEGTSEIKIEGDTATFYKYNSNGSRTLIGKISGVSTTNIIAAIVTHGSIQKGLAVADYEQWTVSQKLLWEYWNTWVSELQATVNNTEGKPESATVDVIGGTAEWNHIWNILKEDTGNRTYSVTEAEKTALEQVLAGGKTYNANIYLLDPESGKEPNESWAFEYNSSYIYYTVGQHNGLNNLAGRAQMQSLIMVDVPVKVTKVWEDDNNSAGFRPDAIKVELYKNGLATGETLILDDSNNWTSEFKFVTPQDQNGEIIYTVKEVAYYYENSDDSNIEGGDDYYSDGYYGESTSEGTWYKGIPSRYTSSGPIGDQYSGYTITNTLESIEIPVTKVWDDSNDNDGIRPSAITVELYANGVATGKTITLTETNNWTGKFAGLTEYINGQKVVYTVKDSVNGYTMTTEGNESNNYQITNTRIPGKTDIKVVKEWKDENNFDEIRPSEVKVELYANGAATGKTVTLNESNKWTATFEDLNQYANGVLIEYTVQETAINGYEAEYVKTVQEATEDSVQVITYTITNIHELKYNGYIEISGKVWLDRPDGKANDINGKLDDDESGIEGIKVILKDANGNQFDATSIATTDSKGNYTIKVNYDNSNKTYKLYEDSATVEEKLKTAYVEFEYDGMKFTTVANATTGTDTSKAKENEALRNDMDSKYSKITSATDPSVWENEKITASTQNVISFENYSDKISSTRKETLKYCNGDGTYVQTNTGGAWKDRITGTDYNCTASDHSETGHVLKTYNVSLTSIKNVNLGLFEREQPDVAIFSDLKEVIVTMDNEEYTYAYGSRGSDLEAKGGLKVKFQNKDVYTYRRPVNPVDAALIQQNKSTMSVKVIYEVRVANLSTTLPVTVHNITNYFDTEYTLNAESWTTTLEEGFSKATYNGDLNITVQPGHQSDAIELTYEISQDAIKNLLNEDATLNNAVEIESYSTVYGEKTLYAEQVTGGRTGKSYGGYDYDSHPGNAEIVVADITDETTNKTTKRLQSPQNPLEDDTDFAPSFVLHIDRDAYKVMSGNVWEDTVIAGLANGLKDDGENKVENVKIELYEIDTEGNHKLAKIYALNDANELISSEAITYSDADGNYSINKVIDKDGKEYKGGISSGTYYLKFTYGNADGSNVTKINGTEINGRNYKSTIVIGKIAEIFKGNDIDSNNNVIIETENVTWISQIDNNVSVAIDNMSDKTQTTELQNTSALTKMFKIGIDDTKLDVFNFGIVARPKEDIKVSKVVTHMTVTLANGQKLIDGNPNDKLSYVKAINNNADIENASRRIIAEIDSELIQGATLNLTYQIKVTNNSAEDYNDKGWYYYGIKPADVTNAKPTIEVIDYLGADLVHTADGNWEAVNAEDLYTQGLITEKVRNAVQKEKYQVFKAKFENLGSGESATVEMKASKLLANQEDDYTYDNHVEILKVNSTLQMAKDYTPGNYVPGEGPNEQDDDNINVIITPPTGIVTYIMYTLAGLAGLAVIGIAIMFIKKKVLTK